jgi:hypothetical protein
VKLVINSIEVHPQLGHHNGHPVDGALVGADHSGHLFTYKLSLQCGRFILGQFLYCRGRAGCIKGYLYCS